MNSEKIPKPTIKRLMIYHRCLESMVLNGTTKASSKDIADNLGIKASQVRKDLSYFGEFGKRGVGYDLEQLINSLGGILGIHKLWNFSITGMGNLGMALANYPGLVRAGFLLKALFDNDSRKIGTVSSGLTIEPLTKVNELIKEKEIDIGVITVPAQAAQSVADTLVEAGVRGIVNFAPVRLSLPESVSVEEIDISVSFRSLAFNMDLRSGFKG